MTTCQDPGPRGRLAKLGLLLGVLVLCTAFGCGAGGGGEAAPPVEVPVFNATRAFGDLQQQVDFGPRNPGSAGHAACRQWLLAQLRSRAPIVEEQPFTFQAATGERFELANLLASFPGTGSEKGPVLLCAHWDTRPVADQDPDPAKRGEPILGANDGASGVAVLLELARHFQATPPPRTVHLALFDLEDCGQTPLTEGEPYGGFSIGARHFAADPGQFRAVEGVLLDMVADESPRFFQEPNSLEAAPGLVRELWSTARQLGYHAFSDERGPAMIDDHLPLIAAGIPTVDIIDFDYPGPDRHIYWHTTQDTPDNCRPEGLEATGQTLLQWLYGGASPR